MASSKRVRNAKTLFAVWLAVVLCFSAACPAECIEEYTRLTARGNSMSPTINDGDTVTVKLTQDGSVIKVGYVNSAEPGDIIVYSVIAALAYFPNPNSMWIGHRAVQKYEKDGVWCFKTKGDNNPEIDPWEVREYWLLGRVTQINYAQPRDVQPRADSPASPEPQDTPTPPEPRESDNATLPEPRVEIPSSFVVVGLLAGFTLFAFIKFRHKKQMEILRNANVHSCYSCNHFRIQRTYELRKTNGRLGIQEKTDLTKGTCLKQNIGITDVPNKEVCKSYTSRKRDSVLTSATKERLENSITDEVCPRCRSTEISLTSFNQERENYSCSNCHNTWTAPRKW